MINYTLILVFLRHSIYRTDCTVENLISDVISCQAADQPSCTSDNVLRICLY